MTRTIGRGAGLLAAVAFTVGACSGGSASPSAAPSQPATAAPTPSATAAPSESAVAACDVKIWGDEITHLALGAAAEAYTAETGVKVDLVSVPFNEIFTNYETQVPAGTGPDLIIAPHSNLEGWVASGVVAPLEFGDKLDLFVESAASTASVDGKVYMVPLWTENIALIRNKALAPEAPATMEDLVATGLALKEAGKAELVINMGLDPSGGNAYLMYPFMTSLGAPWFGQNADGSYNYSDPQFGNEGGIAFAKLLGDWAERGAINADTGFDVALDRFQTGKAPYLFTGPWDLPTIKEAGIDYAIDILPTTGDQPAAPWLGVFGLALSPKAPCALAATDFATRWMAQADQAKTLFDVGAYPPAQKEAFAAVSSDPDVKAWGENGANAQPLFGNPDAGIVWGPIGKAQVAIMRGEGDPEEIWTEMSTKLVEDLKAKGF